jgi:hypothetical protein
MKGNRKRKGKRGMKGNRRRARKGKETGKGRGE